MVDKNGEYIQELSYIQGLIGGNKILADTGVCISTDKDGLVLNRGTDVIAIPEGYVIALCTVLYNAYSIWKDIGPVANIPVGPIWLRDTMGSNAVISLGYTTGTAIQIIQGDPNITYRYYTEILNPK